MLNAQQWANLSRRIFSLVDIIASLIPVIIAGGISSPGITVGLEGEARGKSVTWQGRDDG